MTIGQLKTILDGYDDDAKVFISNPNRFDSPQAAHEAAEIAYSVYDANGNVWFETFGDMDIGSEVDLMAQMGIDCGWSDDDWVREILGIGFTPEDIRKNCDADVYECLVRAMEEYGWT